MEIKNQKNIYSSLSGIYDLIFLLEKTIKYSIIYIMIIFTIKIIRKNKNITLKELSINSGISISYLSELENNRVDNVSIDVLYKISKALDEDIKNIFFADSEIFELKKEMYKRMDKYGYKAKETLEISNIIDLIVSKKAEKNINSTN